MVLLSYPAKAAHTVLKAHDHFEEWSLKWRFPVNLEKCECSFFSMDPTKHLISLGSLCPTSLFQSIPSLSLLA